jgi:putative Mn2+ efflux pump MntP
VTDTGFWAILVIAIGLSADCFAVATCSSIACKSLPNWQGFRLSLAFGFFQAAMTILGWLAGRTITNLISSYDHWVAFGLLVFVGGRMLWEARYEKEERKTDITQWRYLLLLSIATSLDALAVGLSFAFLKVNLLMAAVTIGITTLVISLAGFMAGKKLGEIIGKGAEIAGGIILIGIGVKILLQHLL